MWRYLKEAFLAPVRMPLVGDFPLNAAGFVCLMILGFGHSGFFFLGLGAEAAYIWALTGSERFRRWVDSKEIGEGREVEANQTESLLANLTPTDRAEHTEFLRTCAKVSETYRLNGTDDVIGPANVEALGKMAVLHARLLVARHQIDRRDAEDDEAGLARDVVALEKALASTTLAEAVRRSKTATLEILRKRLRSLERRTEAREEIQSDLQRIRSQAQLALDNATVQSKPAAIQLDIELSSQILDLNDPTWTSPEPPIKQ